MNSKDFGSPLHGDSAFPPMDEYDRLLRESQREHGFPVREEQTRVGTQILRWCKTPGCPRLTTAEHCCGGCSVAHDGKHEIHEDGPLGHSEACNERHARRSAR